MSLTAVTLTHDMPVLTNSDIELRIRRGERVVVVVSELPLTMFVDAHERQCQANHYQTLEKIRQRHGLGAVEAVAVLACLPFEAVQMLGHEAAYRILYSMIATHNRGMRIAEAASADTRPTGGDALAAPFTSGAVAANSSETPNLSAQGDS